MKIKIPLEDAGWVEGSSRELRRGTIFRHSHRGGWEKASGMLQRRMPSRIWVEQRMRE